MKKHLKSARSISLLTLMSRILGLVRDMICAALFGVGLLWDAFVLAWTIPNLFRRLFGEGALSSAFIPVFTRTMEEDGEEKAFHLARTTITFMALFLVALIALFYFVGSALYFGMAVPEKYRLVIQLLFIIAPYLLFICLTALCGAALNSLGLFALPAAAPVLLNIVWIAGAVIGYYLFGDLYQVVQFMTATLLVGGAIQFALMLWGLHAKGLTYRPQFDFDNPQLGEVKTLMIPVILGLATMQINVILDRLIAEFLVTGHGAVSALYFGNRMIQFPLALIGIAIATAVFPALARQVVQEDRDQFASTLLWAFQMTIFVALPAAVGLMVISDPVIQLLFERGNFGSESVARTSRVLLFYAPTVFFTCLIHVVTRAFYAHRDTKKPVKISIYAMILNIVLNLILVFPLEEAGLALSTSISSAFNLLLLIHVFQRDHESPAWSELVKPGLRCAVGTVLMAGGVIYVLSVYPPGASSLSRALSLGAGLAAGVGIYAAFSLVAKADEARDILKSFRRGD